MDVNMPDDKLIRQLIDFEIKKITKNILKVDIDKIDIDMNLGEYGFNSILLKDLGYKLGKLYEIDIPPIIFFERSTISSLSNFLMEDYKEKVISKHKEELIVKKPLKVSEIYETRKEKRLIPLSKKYKNNKSRKINTNMEQEGVAIIGISGVYPGSKDLQEFWTNLELGKDLITEIPSDRWDWKEYFSDNPAEPNKTNVKWGGFIDDVDKFDEKFFNISPREAELMDPQHRLFIQTTWKAIEDSGYKPSELWGRNIGVFSGVQFADYKELLGEGREIKAQIGTGNAHSMLSNRVSYLLNLKGPSESIDTACSSALVAIHRAVKSLQSGESELAIAGGVSLIISPETFIATSKLGILSPDGRCKTFDKSANGYVRGEGVGALILKPLSRAIEDNDNIYAVIKGTIESHGGRANSLTAPNSEAQGEMLIKVYEEAGLEPETISYIEAHGTGTELGDPVEIRGLKQAFSQLAKKRGSKLSKTNYCGIGSVKTNIGHLEPASGIAGITKLILALKNKTIPKTLHFKDINPYIELDNTPFYIVDKTTKWEQLLDENGNKIPRRGGVSSFGFGGTYAHVILEEYEEPIINRYMENDQQVIIISAKCKESLKEYIRDITVFINNNDSINLQELAYTLQVGREEMNERIAIVVSGFEELRNILSKYIQDEEHINNLYVGTSKKDKSNLVNTGEINRLIINRKLQEIAQKWVCGEETDWKLLHNNKKIKRISLPSYSFLKNRHWIEKSKNKKHEESELNKNDNVDIINIDNNTINFDIKDLSKKFEEDLIKIVAIVLKMNEHEIDLDMEFSEFGFDSITFVEFSNLLNDKYKLNIIASTFYEHSILLSLLEYLMEEYENDLTSYYKDSLKKINNHIVTDNNSESKNQETSISNIPTDDIAIIGLNGRYPMANNLLELWDNFVNAKDCVAEIPIKRWDYNKYYDPDKQKLGKSNCKWGGFLEDIESFDPLFFNISPIEARFMDPQERMFLETVHHTLEDSGYSRTRIEKSKVGVFVGVMYGEYQLYGVEEDLKGNPLSLGSSYASIANRVSYFYNLKGPSIALDTMCSSALTAVHLACESIYRGESEMAIAGGVNASLHPNKYLMLTQNGLASSDGKCHSFGDGGDGYVPGEGAGAILLKPLKKAKEDGDYIHGVIKGISINHGGRSNGYIVPNGTSQAEVITETIEKSEVNPRAINYIEGQGTGTPLGDSIEISSLSKAFKKYTKEKKYCPIGSAKSNIGHLESAGGIVAITKVLLQMKYKKIVPSLHSEKLNPNINFEETPFYIQHELTEWEQPVIDGEKHPRCAGINAFGAGGTNVHMIIEEYENEQLNYNIDKEEGTLVTVSARNKDRLKVYAKDLYKHLENNEEDIPVNNIAYTLQMGREAMEERLAVNVSNTKELIERLKEYCNGTKSKKIYIGNSKKNKLQLKNMLYGKEKEEYINELIVNKDLDMLAQLWALGANINWDLFYKSIKYSLVSLPLYPFDKKSYWVPKAKGGNKVENIVENVVQIEELQNKKVENVNQIEESVHVKLDEDLFQRVLKNIINCTCEILGIDEGDIDSDIELVEYGMNSILMVRLANIIKEEYDNLTSFGMLFQEATLSSMAKHITENILLSEATKKPKTTRAKQSEVKSKRIVDNSRIDIVDGTSLITNNILINGVTGLLGGRTLKEYLETTNSTLYCLVRGENKDKARERILNMLSTYGLDETIKLKFEQRVVPVIGDITKHKLGLDEEEYNNLTNTIDMVVHIAGKISLHGFYEEVKPVNVDGTRNMIDFALKTKQKYFIHTSTIAIMGDCLLKNCPPYTEDDFYIGQEFENMGYEQSKFEAEEMVRASSKDGLKWIVVRSGYIMGDSKNGFYPFGITSVPGVFYDYIKTAIEMKTFFNSPLYFDVTPVDYISRAIVHFSTQNKNIYEIYHLCNPNPCTLNDIINCVIKYGYKIDIVNFNRFLNKIKNKDNSYRSMATELTLLNYSDDSYGYSSVDATYTKEILEEVGIICPKVDEKLIKIYLDHCIEVGYLKEPKRKTIKEKVK